MSAGRRSPVQAQVVMPIGQAMICDLVPEHERGTAFGIMKSVCSVLCLGKSHGERMGKSQGFTQPWPWSQPWDRHGTWMMMGTGSFWGNRMDRIQVVHVGHVRWTWKIYYIEKSMRDTGSRSGKRKFGWTSVCKKMDEMDEFLVCKFIFLSWLSICSVSRDCMDSLRDLKNPLRMVRKKTFPRLPKIFLLSGVVLATRHVSRL